MTTFSTDPALYIFTSLTAGSSHIVTATSRLETILRANRVPFKAVDLATDEKARMLWGRRSGKDASGRVRKLPGLVQEGLVLGDLVEIEDWNEYGELKQHVKIYFDEHTIPNINEKPPEPPKKKVVRRVVKKPAAAAAATTSTAEPSSGSTPAPPAAPPLPETKAEKAAAAKIEAENKRAAAAVAAQKTTLAVRSVADEAASRAKELRLKTLREKVHGKGVTLDIGAANKEDTLRETLQSPKSEAWQRDASSESISALLVGGIETKAVAESKVAEQKPATKEEPIPEKKDEVKAEPKKDKDENEKENKAESSEDSTENSSSEEDSDESSEKDKTKKETTSAKDSEKKDEASKA